MRARALNNLRDAVFKGKKECLCLQRMAVHLFFKINVISSVLGTCVAFFSEMIDTDNSSNRLFGKQIKKKWRDDYLVKLNCFLIGESRL